MNQKLRNLGVLSVLFICALVQFDAGGAPVVWTNLAGGNWTAAANWSPNQIPGAADTAIITNAGTYGVSLDANATIAGLELGGASGTQTLSLASPTLNLTGAGTVGANGAFVLNGGTLDGAGTITVNGRFDWLGGFMQGAGQTVFSPAAALALSTAATKFLRDRTVSIEGTATWSGGQWYGGYGAVVNVQGGATLNVESEAGAPLWFGAMTLNNAGTIRKSTGNGQGYFNWTVSNSNLVEVSAGTLGFNGGGFQTGLFRAGAPGATVHFGGGRHELLSGVNFGGPGLFSIGDIGDVRFQTDLTTGTRWRLSGNAALNGTNTVTFTGSFEWQGGTMADTGQIVFSPDATLNLTTPSTKYLRDRAVSIEGVASWSAGQWFGGYGAVVNIQNGAVMHVESEAGAPVWFGAITLNNLGTLRKSAGVGLSYFNWTVNNGALVQAQGGTLGFYGGGAQTGVFETTATPNSVHFGGGRHELLPGVDFTGPGLFSIGDTADVRFQTDLASSARWQLSGQGALNGTNTVTFTGTFVWEGGTMGDSGQTVFPPGSFLYLQFANTKFLRDRTVTIGGQAFWSGGQWYGGYGATLNVQDGAALNVESEAGAPVWFGVITLNNAGTLRKPRGLGLSSFNWIVNNSGTVDVQSGTLGLYGGGAQTGLFQTTDADATVHFGGGRHELLPGVGFTGPGLFSIGDNGDVRFQTPLTTGARWRLSSNAALNGTNVVTFTGPFDWQSGTMGDLGQTMFGPSSVVTLSTPGTKFLRDRRVNLAGTATWAGGQWYGGYGAALNILGSGVLDAQSAAGAPVWFGTIFLNNHGTLRKSAGAGLASFNWTVTNYAAVRAQSGTLGFHGSYVQSSGATTLEGGHLAGALLDIRSGELRGAGNIAADVRNWADVHPGAPFNFLSISNNVTQVYSNTASGRLNLQLGGLIPGAEHDQLRVNGQVNLSGTINVDFLNGFVPMAGNSFTVMTYTARSGQFSGIVSPPGITLQAAYFPTHLVLNAVTVTQVPPFIITQPTNVVVKEGLTASFRVVAGGTPTLNYQWQLNGTNLPGATGDVLVIPNVTVTNAGAYRVLVSNLGGFTNSVNALLIVEPGFKTVELESGVTNALSGVSFFNGLNGAIVGRDGAMRVTRDGGATWTTVNTGMTNITDVQFIGGAIYLVGGGAHTICVSYDGGQTWSAAYTGPERLRRVRFASPTYGFAVGDDGAVVVWDGSSWTPMDTPIDVRLLSLDFCGGIPVAVGEAGQIWRFEGTNWILRHTEVNLATFNDVRFCGNGSVGLAVGAGAVIYQTTDCGLSWSLYDNPAFGLDLHSITFGDCGHWWIAGDDGTMLFSDNGGATWGIIYTGATNRITSVVFIDGVGYYVDDGGHIHRFFYAPIPFNPPPVVAFIASTNRFTNFACVPFPLHAVATDPNGFVASVEFLANSQPFARDVLAPYRTAWTNDVLGEFSLTAVATDNQGAQGVSDPITVVVIKPPLHVLTLGGMTTNRLFKCCLNGEPGRDYEVYAHTNVESPFVTWELLGLMTHTNDILVFIDADTTNHARRFYRARQAPLP